MGQFQHGIGNTRRKGVADYFPDRRPATAHARGFTGRLPDGSLPSGCFARLGISQFPVGANDWSDQVQIVDKVIVSPCGFRGNSMRSVSARYIHGQAVFLDGARHIRQNLRVVSGCGVHIWVCSAPGWATPVTGMSWAVGRKVSPRPVCPRALSRENGHEKRGDDRRGRNSPSGNQPHDGAGAVSDHRARRLCSTQRQDHPP